MKEDLAGGKLPSDDFGVNAAWWWIMILALNLNNAMKRLVLGKRWIARRMKAIRFHLINLPARVMTRSRELFVRLPKNHPCLNWLVLIRDKIGVLASASPGWATTWVGCAFHQRWQGYYFQKPCNGQVWIEGALKGAINAKVHKVYICPVIFGEKHNRFIRLHWKITSKIGSSGCTSI